MFAKKNAGDNLLKSVLLAYLILALHIVLIAAMAILVLFFRGVVNYMLWIVIGGIGILGLSTYWMVRRLRTQGKSLGDMLSNPMFKGRPVEVSLLGGMATVKLGQPTTRPLALAHDETDARAQDDHPQDNRTRDVAELAELARLLEKDLITLDEFNRAKQRLLNQ